MATLVVGTQRCNQHTDLNQSLSVTVIKRKVYAYVTHGDRLLVFVHPDSPEAGIQVPGGSLEEGEEPEAGALREATEETGRTDLEVVRFLGEVERDLADYGMDEIHHRYFFHLRCTGDPPERWRHGELTPSDGSTGPIPFDFYWVPLAEELPELIADMGVLVDLVRASTAGEGRSTAG
jgi:8-oxo-dGTP diphosphatase